MKIFICVLIAAAGLSSCSDAKFDEAVIPCTEALVPEAEQFPQAWRLVKMTGSIMNSETTGEDMGWQELIVLNADNSFTKTRKSDHKSKRGSGTYDFTRDAINNAVVLTLAYSKGKDIIGSCTSQTETETYYFRTKCKMTGTWLMCDGPGLEYERQLVMDEEGTGEH